MKTLLDKIKRNLAGYDPSADTALLERAFETAADIYASRATPDGRPLLEHCLEAALTLTSLSMDANTLAAAILMGTADIGGEKAAARVQSAVGPEAAALARGLAQMRSLHFSAEERARATQLSELMVAMSQDVRLLLIKLASRLDLMRHLKNAPAEGRDNFAQESIDIYTPLAHRLGMSQLKSELEDLCFEFLFPAEFNRLKRQADESAAQREEAINRVVSLLRGIFKEHDLKVHITGRTKRLYSTYLKMLRQNKDFDQLFDLAAVRIIANSVEDCYRVLALLHMLWTPIPDEFDNYIAEPKPNGYKSIHTVVIAPNNQPVEVQIRTWEMHMLAEYGVAAHFQYKEKAQGKREADEDTVGWVRKMAAVSETAQTAHSRSEDISVDAGTTVYTVTPLGKVISLPAGATPVDFAYDIHTQVGHTCRGAKINGRISTLDQKLRNGDVVEILTSKTGSPSRDWLRFAVSPQARNKIRAWFKKQDRDENIVQGRMMLHRELQRAGLKREDLLEKIDIDDLLESFSFKSEDDFHAALGCGDISLGAVMERYRRAYRELLAVEEPASRGAARARTTIRKSRKQDVIVEGLPDVMVSFPKCCFPAPGDPIVGFVTRGRGLAIHRSQCPNVRSFVESGDRIVPVSWGETSGNLYIAEIEINSIDRVGVLQEILAVISEAKLNVVEMTSKIMKDTTALTTIRLEVGDIEDVSRILPRISSIIDVISARRKL
ncbi:MAG TPA: bifunctional (p)ppGpp synthetase/guanosine-3',5'-bis(diphosphate) 3'-pyrophosphohydrolase [bacterium]|nr:bifunctional (p)ppGpp synthetase/guanosine-3',5'-bis(diphosphate) 3'-pyrophosphohydrolase [bacterium]